MKRKILILCVVLILLLSGAVIFTVSRANSVLALLKPEIEQAIGAAVGSKVEIGELQLSILGQEIEVKRLSFGAGEHGQTTVESARVKANLRSLLEKRLEIESVELVGAALSITRTEQGTEISGLPRKAHEPTRIGSDTPDKITNGVEAPNGSNVALQLKKFSLTRGQLRYKDSALQKEFVLSNISLIGDVEISGERANITGVSASGELNDFGMIKVSSSKITHDFSTQSTVLDAGALSIPAGEITLGGSWAKDRGSFTAASKSLSSEILSTFGEKFAPSIAPLKIKGSLGFDTSMIVQTGGAFHYVVEGLVNLSNVSATLSEKMLLSSLAGAIQVRIEPGKYSAASKELLLKINGEQLSTSFESSTDNFGTTFPTFSLVGFGGTSGGNLTMKFKDGLDFGSHFKGSNLSIDAVLQTLKPEMRTTIAGTLAQIDNEVLGELKKIPQSLRAHGSAVIKDGVLKGTNLPGLVLKKVEGIPLLQGSLYMMVPPTYQPLFASPDTPIKSLEVTYGISGTSVNLLSLMLHSDIFSLKGKGTILGNGSLDLDTTIYFTQEFSAALCGSQRELTKILAADGRLTFPLSISGIPPKVVVVPNIKEVLKLAAQRVVKDKAVNALDKALGGSGRGKLLADAFGL